MYKTSECVQEFDLKSKAPMDLTSVIREKKFLTTSGVARVVAVAGSLSLFKAGVHMKAVF